MLSYFCSVSWWLRGGRTPHSSVRPGCSLLHGYRQLCLAIGSGSAVLPSHWLSKEINSAFIGGVKVADCCDWSSCWAPAPWRLGLCKHPGCFFQWSVFISSSVLPVCADWGWESLRSRESGESEANWLPVLPYALWLKKHSALLWHFDNITGEDANNPQSVGSRATLPLSSRFILRSNVFFCISTRCICCSGWQRPHRLRVIPLVISSAAVSQGSDMENKLPRVLNDRVGLFVLVQ